MSKIIVGIDEVGRGCLAGPLVAAAVILEKPIGGIKDSKLLSKLNREKYASLIYKEALDFGIGWTEVDEMNQKGLTFAVSNAMQIALSKITHNYDQIIIDGNFNFLDKYDNVTTLIKADLYVQAVSAASIIAKVYRDKWMSEIAIDFPEYGFEKHMGYGTKYHLEMIKKYGPVNQHRKFYKPLLKYST